MHSSSPTQCILWYWNLLVLFFCCCFWGKRKTVLDVFLIPTVVQWDSYRELVHGQEWQWAAQAGALLGEVGWNGEMGFVQQPLQYDTALWNVIELKLFFCCCFSSPVVATPHQRIRTRMCGHTFERSSGFTTSCLQIEHDGSLSVQHNKKRQSFVCVKSPSLDHKLRCHHF